MAEAEPTRTAGAHCRPHRENGAPMATGGPLPARHGQAARAGRRERARPAGTVAAS